MNFHETKYGSNFFHVQLPSLIKALERVADSLDRSGTAPQGAVPDPNFLRDLYYGDYEPSIFKEQSSRQMELNRAVSAAETILREAMWGSPDTMRAFEAYLIAVGEQQSAVTEQAFESGYKTAMQMLLAGGPVPGAGHDPELPLTTQELRKMDGERVYCLELNEEVRVSARKTGFIKVMDDKENYPSIGLTLYRRRPSWCISG